jgi:hypothetical protein
VRVRVRVRGACAWLVCAWCGRRRADYYAAARTPRLLCADDVSDSDVSDADDDRAPLRSTAAGDGVAEAEADDDSAPEAADGYSSGDEVAREEEEEDDVHLRVGLLASGDVDVWDDDDDDGGRGGDAFGAFCGAEGGVEIDAEDAPVGVALGHVGDDE